MLSCEQLPEKDIGDKGALFSSPPPVKRYSFAINPNGKRSLPFWKGHTPDPLPARRTLYAPAAVPGGDYHLCSRRRLEDAAQRYPAEHFHVTPAPGTALRAWYAQEL